ncbi:hypothetical protein [Vreelandella massiliensis]|uniref:hypothetical protein n=1 Tax=Vreelandella massiliensis TaxID=1816686 RepID=UPI00096A540F|nr:hypothetical protein [Halomonas massiliensis]
MTTHHPPTINRLQTIVDEHQYEAFTWQTDDPDDEPLIVDPTTAALLVQVHNMLERRDSAKAQEARAKMAESRARFGLIVDKAWALAMKQ